MNSNWSYGRVTAKLGFDLCDLDLWLLTLIFCADITSADSNNSWKFMMIWCEEHSEQGVQRATTPLSPYISERISHSWGQQVENCKSSPLTHHLADVFVMQAHCASNIVSYSHLFHPESIDLPIPKILLSEIWPENPRSRSWVRSKFSSHNLGPTSYPLTSFWFHVNPPSYSYDSFENVTFKIQRLSHSSRSHSK